MMQKTRIADMANRHCGKLSKGYRQRVGLAQALLHNPEVLILDEPTAGLDPKQIIETRQLIKGLGGDHTIILSTHILPEVSQTCQRVVIINRGQGRRRGHARQPHVAAARLGDDVPAGGCAGRRMPRRCSQRVSGVTRVAIADTKQQVVGYEVDSEAGTRRAARACRRRGQPRLGTARDAPDAHEPRRDLPARHDRRCRAPAAVAEAHSISSEQVAHE